MRPSERGPVVEFRALGPLEALVAGQPVSLGTPKQRALLALLVSRIGHPVSAEMILETLWSGRPPPSATTSLQAYVANLRRVLEPDRAPRRPPAVLRTCASGYLLDARMSDVDVRWFGEHATAGWQAADQGDQHRALSEFKAALALWRGKAYAEVASVAHVAPEADRLEELRLSVIEARCAALLAVGAHEVAVPELEALIDARPMREYGCELLSLALYRAGRQADALEVLRTLRKRLADEVGIDPRPALQHLQQEIMKQVPDLDWQPTPTVAAADGTPAAAPPFIGRETAMRRLSELLTADGGAVVVVSGEPGIGKTSLLRRFADTVSVPVLWGSCPEHAEASVLWPWEQILRAAVTAFPRLTVPSAVAELVAGNVAGEDVREFTAIAQFLHDAGPLVIILDQLHRADPGSQRLLAHLAESAGAGRMLLIAAYRQGEGEALGETLAALARAEATRIELSGLNNHDTRLLTACLLRREVDRQTAEDLWERTDGNPFLLRALICGEPNALAVRDLVSHRVGRLPAPAPELLAMAAVAGRQVDIEVVAQAAGVDLETALSAMDCAVAAGLMVEDPRRLGWFRFAHGVTAEVLYENTGRLRRLRRHLRVGAASAKVWRDDPQRAAETARHWLLAAELEPAAAAEAVRYAAVAARLAAANLAFSDAVQLWRQALAATDLVDPAQADRYPLLLGLGTSMCRTGNPHDGLAVLMRAAQEAFAARDAVQLTTAAVAAVGELEWSPIDTLGRQLITILESAQEWVMEAEQRSLVESCLAVACNRRSDRAGGQPRPALSAAAVSATRLA